ncbi:transcription factor ets-4-like isoform X2 [Hydra vulgaris]|uniref:Transcription factor ets-4-like isoform X2 n=1 Tax=Hydra vulgaris TaxID=6087 RepID=A0ABM4BZ47_HYDVU
MANETFNCRFSDKSSEGSVVSDINSSSQNYYLHGNYPNFEDLMALDISDFVQLQKHEIARYKCDLNTTETALFQRHISLDDSFVLIDDGEDQQIIIDKHFESNKCSNDSNDDTNDKNLTNASLFNLIKKDGFQIEEWTYLKNTTSDKIRLYEYLLYLLKESQTDCVRWINKQTGEFEITSSAKISLKWGKLRGNPKMTYEKLARALRHYYKKNILCHYKHREKLRYKFSEDILKKYNV